MACRGTASPGGLKAARRTRVTSLCVTQNTDNYYDNENAPSVDAITAPLSSVSGVPSFSLSSRLELAPPCEQVSNWLLAPNGSVIANELNEPRRFVPCMYRRALVNPSHKSSTKPMRGATQSKVNIGVTTFVSPASAVVKKCAKYALPSNSTSTFHNSVPLRFTVSNSTPPEQSAAGNARQSIMSLPAPLSTPASFNNSPLIFKSSSMKTNFPPGSIFPSKMNWHMTSIFGLKFTSSSNSSSVIVIGTNFVIALPPSKISLSANADVAASALDANTARSASPSR
jgi:hypothetical protein